MYISGVPGIGKTACFMEVLYRLRKEAGGGRGEEGEEFLFIHINAMNIS